MDIIYPSSKRLPSLSSLKVVLFDMDGTLVHLQPDGRKVVLNETLAHFGIAPIAEDCLVDRFWFTSERYQMIDGWGIPRLEFWAAFDNERLLPLQMDYTFAYSDVAGNLTRLSNQNLRLGVVSNSAHKSLRHKLDLLEPHISRHHFEVVVSCHDDVPRSKPHADGLELALARMGVAPHEAILIGDSLDDIGAGAAAGVPVLLINRGQLETIFRLLEGHPHLTNFGVLDSLHDLHGALGLTEQLATEERAA